MSEQTATTILVVIAGAAIGAAIGIALAFAAAAVLGLL